MGLVACARQPGVKRVIDHAAVPELLLVVRKELGQTQRDGQQPRALRGEIRARGVGTAHDRRQLRQRGVVEPVLQEERVEGAERTVVRKLDALDVIRRRAALAGHPHHLGGRYEQELRVGIDEAQDQPRAGDAVDLRALSRNPLHQVSGEWGTWESAAAESGRSLKSAWSSSSTCAPRSSRARSSAVAAVMPEKTWEIPVAP